MHLLVLDRDSVDSEFLRHEVHSIQAVLHLSNLRRLCDTARGGDGGAEVEGRDAWELEGEAAL